MARESSFEKSAIAGLNRFFDKNQQGRAETEAKTLIKKPCSIKIKTKILSQFEHRFDKLFFRDILNRLLLIGDNDYEFLNYYAAAFSRLGEADPATNALKKAIKIKPDETLAYLNLFRMFLSTDGADKLKEFVVDELDHSLATAAHILGEGSKIAEEFADKPLSLWLGERSLELRKDIEIQLIVATRYFELDDFQTCTNLLEELLEECPERLDIQNLRGLVYYRQHELGKAEQLFRGIISNDPKSFFAWTNLSIVLLEAKQVLEALECALFAYDLNPNADAAHCVGNAYRMNGLYREAVDYFKKGFDLSGDVASLINLSVALLDCGETVKALNVARKANSIDPNYPPNYWNLTSFANDLGTAVILMKKYCTMTTVSSSQSSLALRQRAQHHLIGCESVLKQSGELLDNEKWRDEPIIRSYRYWIKRGLNAQLFYNRWKLFDFCIQEFPETNQLGFYEFGVFTGYSFRYISNHFDFNFGFDTFSGIPEDWHGENAGSYSSYGQIPDIENAEFFAGLFEDTLPSFMQEPRPKAAIINFDADLYSSTITALNWMEPLITADTILIFDEFLINDHWELDEYKALEEFCEKKQCEYEIFAGSMLTKQVAVKLKL